MLDDRRDEPIDFEGFSQPGGNAQCTGALVEIMDPRHEDHRDVAYSRVGELRTPEIVATHC